MLAVVFVFPSGHRVGSGLRFLHRFHLTQTIQYFTLMGCYPAWLVSRDTGKNNHSSGDHGLQIQSFILNGAICTIVDNRAS